MSKTLFENALIITMNARREILRGNLIVQDDRIKEIVAADSQSGRPSASDAGAVTRMIDASGCALLPGFVQAHVHLCQTLFRNRAEDLKLLDWLQQRIWPFEGAHNATSMAISARLGIAELLAGGTTTILDMGSVHHYDRVFTEAERHGIRMAGGKCMMDAGAGVPPNMLETAEASLRASDELRQAWHRAANNRLRYAYAPRFALSCSEAVLREVAGLARDHSCLVHTHAAESAEEEEMLLREKRLRSVPFLEKMGIAGAHCCFAHCVQADETEQTLLAHDGTRVAHCPSSNLKLASGVAPIVEMLQLGITVGLGADGAPCNNNLNVWQEMRLAGLLQKLRHGPAALPARTVVELATINGAKCLGWEDQIGSLEIGKKADLVMLRMDGLHAIPGGDDPYSQIVYATSASDVQLTVVDGRVCYENGEYPRLDPEQIRREGEAELGKLLKRM